MSKKFIAQKYASETTSRGFAPTRYKPKERDRESVVSQFLITFNTNAKYTPGDLTSRRAFDKLETMVERLRAPGATEHWANMVKIAPVGVARPATLPQTQEVSDLSNLDEELQKQFDVTVKATGIEVGDKMHRLHGHMFVKITHKSRLHIDRDKTKAEMNSILEDIEENVPGVPTRIQYVNVQWIPHSSAAVRAYVTKNKKALRRGPDSTLIEDIADRAEE